MDLYGQRTKDKVQPDIAAGCKWAINSAEHNYCFWEYAKDLDAPIPIKTIAALLGMTVQGVKAELESALEKLRSIKDSPLITDLVALVGELGKNDPAVPGVPTQELQEYLEKIRQYHENNPNEDPEEFKPKKPGRKHSMPIHRDGKKVDLYGIYTDKTRERLKQEGRKADKRK